MPCDFFTFTQPAHIEFGIRENVDLFWNGGLLALDALPRRFALEAAKQPQTVVHICADRHVYCKKVAQDMASATKGGLDHLLAMVAVGVWSVSALPASKAWWGPTTFMLALVVNVALGATGVTLAFLE